jgi:hypothetical protein
MIKIFFLMLWNQTWMDRKSLYTDVTLISMQFKKELLLQYFQVRNAANIHVSKLQIISILKDRLGILTLTYLKIVKFSLKMCVFPF